MYGTFATAQERYLRYLYLHGVPAKEERRAFNHSFYMDLGCETPVPVEITSARADFDNALKGTRCIPSWIRDDQILKEMFSKVSADFYKKNAEPEKPDPVLKSYLEYISENGLPNADTAKRYSTNFYKEKGFGTRIPADVSIKLQYFKGNLLKGVVPRWVREDEKLAKISDHLIKQIQETNTKLPSQKSNAEMNPAIGHEDSKNIVRKEIGDHPKNQRTEGLEELMKRNNRLELQMGQYQARCEHLEEKVRICEDLIQKMTEIIQNKDEIIVTLKASLSY